MQNKRVENALGHKTHLISVLSLQGRMINTQKVSQAAKYGDMDSLRSIWMHHE